MSTVIAKLKKFLKLHNDTKTDKTNLWGRDGCHLCKLLEGSTRVTGVLVIMWLLVLVTQVRISLKIQWSLQFWYVQFSVCISYFNKKFKKVVKWTGSRYLHKLIKHETSKKCWPLQFLALPPPLFSESFKGLQCQFWVSRFPVLRAWLLSTWILVSSLVQ